MAETITCDGCRKTIYFTPNYVKVYIVDCMASTHHIRAKQDLHLCNSCFQWSEKAKLKEIERIRGNEIKFDNIL